MIGDRSSQSTTEFLEHKTFGGVLFPTRIRFSPGKKLPNVPSELLIEVRSLEVNRVLDDYRFVVPSPRNAEKIEISRDLHRMLDQLASGGGDYSALAESATRSGFIQFLVAGLNPSVKDLSVRLLGEQWKVYRARTNEH